jgi:hypothetical protein
MNEELIALRTRIEYLEAQVAQLTAQVAHDNETRAQLLATCESLVPRMVHITQASAAQVAAVRAAPEVQAQREGSLFEFYAKLATRVRALEEGFEEMREVLVDYHSTLKDAIELLKRPS